MYQFCFLRHHKLARLHGSLRAQVNKGGHEYCVTRHHKVTLEHGRIYSRLNVQDMPFIFGLHLSTRHFSPRIHVIVLTASIFLPMTDLSIRGDYTLT